MSSTAKTATTRRASTPAPMPAEPSTEAAPVPEPSPTRGSTQPTKRQPKAKGAQTPTCPRKHTAEGAIARCAAYYERNGHFRPSHIGAAHDSGQADA